jgi:cell division protein FtsB
MTVNEIVDELRGARPRASDALRLQVMTIATRPAPRTPTIGERLRGRRRLALIVPAGAAVAMAAAVVIGVTRSGSTGPVVAAAPESTARSAGTTGEALVAPPTAADAATAQKAAPGPLTGRLQRYGAALSLEVEDNDALSDATQQALRIARDLGGYVVSVHYATGDQGSASLTLRVPTANAADAVTRLSGLGTILAQNVQIDDLQESLDALDRREQQVRARIAALGAAIERAGDDAERARLEEQRAQARAELRTLRASQAATAAEARNATVQLDLQTKRDSGGAVPGSGSRLDRALDKALAVLAWEGIVLLAVAIAVAPLALVAAGVWATRRTRRRHEEDRLLAAP